MPVLLVSVGGTTIYRIYLCGYQVLSRRSYRLIVIIILQGHPGSSGALWGYPLCWPPSVRIRLQPTLVCLHTSLMTKEIYLLQDYRHTFGVIWLFVNSRLFSTRTPSFFAGVLDLQQQYSTLKKDTRKVVQAGDLPLEKGCVRHLLQNNNDSRIHCFSVNLGLHFSYMLGFFLLSCLVR